MREESRACKHRRARVSSIIGGTTVSDKATLANLQVALTQLDA